MKSIIKEVKQNGKVLFTVGNNHDGVYYGGSDLCLIIEYRSNIGYIVDMSGEIVHTVKGVHCTDENDREAMKNDPVILAYNWVEARKYSKSIGTLKELKNSLTFNRSNSDSKYYMSIEFKGETYGTGFNDSHLWNALNNLEDTSHYEDVKMDTVKMLVRHHSLSI